MSSRDFESKRSKRQFWQGHIEAWQASGLSQADYCRENALNYHQFQYWKRRLARVAETSLVELPIPVMLSHGGFSPPSPIRVVCNHSCRVEVEPGFDAETLAEVIRVLERL